jgi:hypothetical protein
LLKVREKEVHDGEGEDGNKEDDTLFQYCSEDEGGATTEVDNDDYFQLKLQCIFPFCDDFTW